MIAPKVKMWNESFYPKEWILIDAAVKNVENRKKYYRIALKSRIVEKVKEIGYL